MAEGTPLTGHSMGQTQALLWDQVIVLARSIDVCQQLPLVLVQGNIQLLLSVRPVLPSERQTCGRTDLFSALCRRIPFRTDRRSTQESVFVLPN